MQPNRRGTGAGAGKRSAPQRDSFRQPPPATPQFTNTGGRDSDASFCSVRPSFSGAGTGTRSLSITDGAYKQTAVRAINTYLSSHNLPLSLSLKPIPSAKDINEVFRFLFSRLELSVLDSGKLEDDLMLVLKLLNCPHKINKSALRAPGAPHSFPYCLAIIHWLVQLADYADHLRSDDNSNRFSFMNNTLMEYTVNSYLHYMKGDDEAVETLDRELAEKMEKERDLLVDNLKTLDEEGKKLESDLEGLKFRPSEREVIENQRKDLEGDLVKFQGYIATLQDANAITEKALEDRAKELAAKVEEIKRIREDNEELKKTVEAQGISSRDAERMRRELLAVERDINEGESSRSSWEEKCWALDRDLRKKFSELEDLSSECNKALRRLKLQGDYQYLLNANGSTPAELLGIDYKSTLKPAINSFADEIKRGKAEKLEEFISLQQQYKEMITKIETKGDHLAKLQYLVDERTRQVDSIRNDIEQFTSRCANECQRIREDMEARAASLDIMEREASDTLKVAELTLQEERRQSEEQIQQCAYELFALVDSISRYKERMEAKLSEMKKNLSETGEFISNAYNTTFSALIGTTLDLTNLPPTDFAICEP